MLPQRDNALNWHSTHRNLDRSVEFFWKKIEKAHAVRSLSKRLFNSIVTFFPLSKFTAVLQVARYERCNIIVDRSVLHRDNVIWRNMKLIAKHVANVTFITTCDEEMKTRLRPFPNDGQGSKYAPPMLVSGAFVQCIQEDIHAFERLHKLMQTVFEVVIRWCSVAVAII